MKKWLFIILAFLPLFCKANYDSLYCIASNQYYAIPECVRTGDYVGIWKKSLTYLSGNTITFSIEVNPNNAFTISKINNDSALITVNNKAYINGQISSQDEIWELIIRTTDTSFGYELDTAFVHIKDSVYCVFLDYSGSSGAGTRDDPDNDLDNYTITDGYGYFFKRDGTINSEVTYINYIQASNPIIFGAYGTGEKPLFDGNGMEMGFFELGDDADRYDGRVENVIFDNIKFYNSGIYALYAYPCCGYLYFWNLDFDGNNYIEGDGTENGQITIGVKNDPRIDYWDIRPVEIIDCIFKNSGGTHIKGGCFTNGILRNCWFGHTEGSTIRFGANKFGSIVSECYIDDPTGGTGSYSIGNFQIRADSMTISNCVMIGNGSNCYLISEDSQVDYTCQDVTIENCKMIGADYGIYANPINETYDNFEDHLYQDNEIISNTIGIYTIGETNLTIRRNKIHGQSDHCIQDVVNGSQESEHIVISYNVLYNSTGNELELDAGSGDRVNNNSIIGTIYADGCSDDTISNNFYIELSGNDNGDANIDIGNIETDDYFEDYLNKDLRLKSTAILAIDESFDWGQTIDFLGHPKSGDNWDIGAYEYQTETESTIVTYKGSISLDDATINGQEILTIKYKGITYKE